MIYRHESKPIIFKNGKWLKEIDERLPFEYNNGVIYEIDGLRLYPHLGWFQRGQDALYMCEGVYNPIGHSKRVAVYKDAYVKVYIYHDFFAKLFVSFYKDAKDVYIVVGAGSDVCYPSLFGQFLNRGYGDEIEKDMVHEAYAWCCDNVLTWIADILYGAPGREEHSKGLSELQRMFWVEDDDLCG